MLEINSTKTHFFTHFIFKFRLFHLSVKLIVLRMVVSQWEGALRDTVSGKANK